MLGPIGDREWEEEFARTHPQPDRPAPLVVEGELRLTWGTDTCLSITVDQEHLSEAIQNELHERQTEVDRFTLSYGRVRITVEVLE